MSAAANRQFVVEKSIVMNPVYEVQFTRHQRSPALYRDSHITQTVTIYPGLHFPSSFALISPTAVTNHTPT